MATLTKDGIPFYIQIRESLREQISHGILELGQKLPSEDELAATYGVSRMTVRQGITDLISAGLLYRRHGQGTFVARSHIERDHTRLTNFFESCREKGINPCARVLCRELLSADEKVAKALLLNQGDPIIRIETLRFVNGIPITLHDTQLPLKLFPQLLEIELESLNLDSRHVWEVMESYGTKVSYCVQRLEARLADGYLSTLLEVEQGSPILYGERVLYADDGIPVKYADCYNRGDKFSLTIEMKR